MGKAMDVTFTFAQLNPFRPHERWMFLQGMLCISLSRMMRESGSFREELFGSRMESELDSVLLARHHKLDQ